MARKEQVKTYVYPAIEAETKISVLEEYIIHPKTRKYGRRLAKRKIARLRKALDNVVAAE